MFQIGDTLLYGTEGVCKMEEICEMKVRSAKAKYYVLRPLYRDGSTVFVPVDNEALTAKMRPLLTVDEINALLEKVSEEGGLWIEDAAERKAEFQKILVSGDRFEILRMIRTLYLRRRELQEKGKRLRTNDEQMLRDAEKLLNDELSLILGISQREVPDYIRRHIEGEN